MNDGDLVLTVDGNTIGGWEEVRVTRGIERCPNDFAIRTSERWPGELKSVVIKPGDACVIGIKNGNVVSPLVTGYVDRYSPSIAAGQHSIAISGRGKCQDLVDCAAEYPSGAFKNMTVQAIAQALASNFSGGIKVICDVPTKALPSFPLSYGETAFEVIDRICRYRKLLAYETPEGNLYLTGPSQKHAKSALVEGKDAKGNPGNVQAASVHYSMDQQFSIYKAYLSAINVYNDAANSDAVLSAVPPVSDGSVTRYRPHIAIIDSMDAGLQVSKDRLTWECNRRRGRSQQLHVTVNSWRDADGSLWEPNRLVGVNIPTLRIVNQTWLISEVTYVRNNQGGTTCEMVVMPQEAFAREPLVFLPTNLIDLRQ